MEKAVLLLYYIVLYCIVLFMALQTERYIASWERYVAIWERSDALWESNVTNVVSMQRHIKLLYMYIYIGCLLS